jgi:hypothetical protein
LCVCVTHGRELVWNEQKSHSITVVFKRKRRWVLGWFGLWRNISWAVNGRSSWAISPLDHVFG